jgi:hypothetical protein
VSSVAVESLVTNARLVAASLLVKNLGAGQGNAAAGEVDKDFVRGVPICRSKLAKSTGARSLLVGRCPESTETTSETGKEDGAGTREMWRGVSSPKPLTDHVQILPFLLWSRLLRRLLIREGWAGTPSELAACTLATGVSPYFSLGYGKRLLSLA